jgi:hypothetical protein
MKPQNSTFLILAVDIHEWTALCSGCFIHWKESLHFLLDRRVVATDNVV